MSYSKNLTDDQWDLIKNYFVYGNYGNRSKYSKRLLVEAVFYITRTGCQWRALPKEFPPWASVYSFFKRVRQRDIWLQVLEKLVAKSRKKQGKITPPSYAIIDSQSVKTTAAAKQTIGIDGGKKIKGRKRHIVVDTLGHLLHVKVYKANVHDTKSGAAVFDSTLLKYPSLQGVCADAGYRGTMKNTVEKELKKRVDIVTRKGNEWKVLAKRWIVERTFAWLQGFRRLSKDFERLTRSAEEFVMIVHVMLLLNRLT